jgi:hypothetical protein
MLTTPGEHGRLCQACYQWQEVLDLVEAIELQPAPGYADPDCGLQPLEEWHRDTLHLMYDEMRRSRGQINAFMAIKAFEMEAQAYYAFIEPEPLPRPVPQISLSDIMERAIRRVVENWKNPSERNLPDPNYQIYQSPGVPLGCDMKGSVQPGQHLSWIIFRHKDRANRLVVATIEHGKAEYNSSSKEIADYMSESERGDRLHCAQLASLNTDGGSRSNGRGLPGNGQGEAPGVPQSIKRLAVALEI